MAGQPDLFIPHKTMPQVKQPEYGDDMRAIEMWAKRLTAGGGASIGYVGVTMWEGSGGNNPAFIGPYSSPGSFLGGPGKAVFPLAGGSSVSTSTSLESGGVFEVNFGGGWIINPASGIFIWQFPELWTPPFTGPNIDFNVSVRGYALDAVVPPTNAFDSGISNTISLGSNVLHTTVLADYPSLTITGSGSDLFQFANGIAQGSNSIIYVIGWSIAVRWTPASTSFP